jgi:hypothetical protein
LAAKWAGIGGKGDSDGGLVDLDFGHDVLYGSYTPMGNSDKRSAGPSYDFTWMLDALNLEHG